MNRNVQLETVAPDDTRLSPLFLELDTYLHSLDGDDLHERVSPYNRLEPGTFVLLAHIESEPVGCGALRVRDAHTGEIKRMFVRPEFRGLGIGQALLDGLLELAATTGQSRVILETVLELGSAVALYRRNGFVRIPNYPPYEDIAESACFEKRLESKSPAVRSDICP